MERSEGRVLEGARILLVEDTDDAREAFGALLGTEGAEVMTAATGREGLDLLERHTFDAVVTDLGLPDVPGEVLVRHVASTLRPRPLIVVVTGYGAPYTVRAREAGADAVITKPIDWGVLLKELESAAGAAQMSRPLAA